MLSDIPEYNSLAQGSSPVLSPRFHRCALRESRHLAGTSQCFSCKQRGRSCSAPVLTESPAELWAARGGRSTSGFGCLIFGVPRLCLILKGWVDCGAPLTVHADEDLRVQPTDVSKWVSLKFLFLTSVRFPSCEMTAALPTSKAAAVQGL